MNQENVYYVGMDIHKKIIAFCVKGSGPIPVQEGTIPATRSALIEWEKLLPHPWIGAMEATLFTGWVYDTLKPYAAGLKVANPLLLKAISASKKKTTGSTREKSPMPFERICCRNATWRRRRSGIWAAPSGSATTWCVWPPR